MNAKRSLLILIVLLAFVSATTAASDYTSYQRYLDDQKPAQALPLATCTTAPAPEPAVVVPSGEDVSMYHYNVMVLDGIDPAIIRTALMFVPNIFDFKIVPEDPTQYTWDGVYAVPITPRLITIFNGTLHGYTHPNAMGYHYWQGRSTVVYLGQDPYPFSWIITHECLHEALKPTSINQDDQPSFVPQWNEWMKARNVGFWSGDERQCVGTGWNRLKEDFLISQAITV